MLAISHIAKCLDPFWCFVYGCPWGGKAWNVLVNLFIKWRTQFTTELSTELSSYWQRWFHEQGTLERPLGLHLPAGPRRLISKFEQCKLHEDLANNFIWNLNTVWTIMYPAPVHSCSIWSATARRQYMAASVLCPISCVCQLNWHDHSQSQALSLTFTKFQHDATLYATLWGVMEKKATG